MFCFLLLFQFREFSLSSVFQRSVSRYSKGGKCVAEPRTVTQAPPKSDVTTDLDRASSRGGDRGGASGEGVEEGQPQG